MGLQNHLHRIRGGLSVALGTGFENAPPDPGVLARHSARKALPGLRQDVHEGKALLFLDDLNGPVQDGSELRRVLHGAEAGQAVGLGQAGEVHRRLIQAGADSGPARGPVPVPGHSQGVLLRIVIRPVVHHDGEKRDVVMRRRPEGGGRV